jgi:hypothetical protein
METGLSLVQEIQDRLSWPVTDSIEGSDGKDPEVRKILLVLNRVLKNLGPMDDWPMLNTEGTLLTNAPVTGSDVRLDLTNGSKTVAISSFDVSDGGSQAAPFLLSHKIWAIQIGSGTPVYRVASVDSPTQITLNKPWIGDSNTPTGADDDTLYDFTMAMDQYALPTDFDRPIDEWKDFLSAYGVKPLSPRMFRSKRLAEGFELSPGDPLWFTVYGLNEEGTYQLLHLHPFPQQQTMMEYSYVRDHPTIRNDKDLILFPASQHGMIVEAVVYLADRDFENDQTFAAALQEFMSQFSRSVGKKSLVSDTKQLTPKVSRMRMAAQSGVRMDWGDFWDRYTEGPLP